MARRLIEDVDLLERLRAQPGGARLLELAPAGAFLVGGAVRDLLLDRRPRELDVVVEGDAEALVAALGSGAERADARAAVVEHPRFGTAVVELEGGARIDVALARRERYPAPGALPEVQPAPLAEDLLRRDFTVNAIALALDGPRPGELRAAPRALEDLRAGRLRVLHERSFLDDPTRLLRLARYRARLGFAVGRRTDELAGAALAQGALATVSGARIGAELRLALAEPDPLAALAELDRLGALRALHPRLRLEPDLARRALELLPADGRADLLALAALALALALRADGDRRAEVAALLDRLEFPAADRDRVAAAAAAVPRLVEELPAAARPSELRAVALAVPLEAVALAGALAADGADAAEPGPAGLAARPRPRAPRAAGWMSSAHVRLRDRRRRTCSRPASRRARRSAAGWRRRCGCAWTGRLPDERDAQLRAALAVTRSCASSCPVTGTRCSRRAPTATSRRCAARTASGCASAASGLGRRWCAGRQVHGTVVRRVRALDGRDGAASTLDADGYATALSGVGAMALTADCLPVVLGSEGAVAALHAGWRGLAAGVLEEGVRALRELGGRRNRSLAAVIGPGAGVCCYEVGEEVHAAFGGAHRRGRNLDLPALARDRLAAAGVQWIEDVALCTICDERLYSHRREGARAGRQAGVAWLS